MTIPKSYEALAADLASEKILSKTLQGQKEEFMMLADSRKVDLDEAMARNAALERKNANQCESIREYQDIEAALLEELELQKNHFKIQLQGAKDADALQQRLTVAEQRDADNLKLISGLVEYADNLLADVNNAWSYAGSTGEPETHKDEDYAAALNLLSATASSHE